MTPAQQAGLKIGATYRVKTTKGEHGWAAGQLVTFAKDDGTSQPKFTRIGYSDVGYEDDYVYVQNVELVTDAVAAPAFTVTKHTGKTTFTVDRELTMDEVKRVLDIIGG